MTLDARNYGRKEVEGDISSGSVDDLRSDVSSKKDEILSGNLKKPASMMDVQLYIVKPSSTV